jgi:hypothetical protein
MTVLEAQPDADAILPFVDEQVRALRDAGGEPQSVLVGPEAYEVLQTAVAARFGRERAHLSQYQWLPVVVDPFRGGAVCVVPAPRDVAEGVRAERV